MSTGIEAFDHSLQLTNLWLKDLMRRLGTEDRHLAYLALRTTLHALRDRLAVDEAAHLGAQFPMLVRGLYYEGWHPAGKPAKERSREAFLAHIRAEAHSSISTRSRRRVRCLACSPSASPPARSRT
jgi:uncharacterized protein (DUF2267 family)